MNTGELIGLLGVGDEPTTGEVRAARRSVAKRVHPDHAGPRTTMTMAEINAASDRLIRSIRSGRKIPRAVGPPVRGTDAGVVRPQPSFRPVYAIVTVALMVFVFAVTALVAGLNPAGLGLALMMAAMIGAGFVVALVALLDRRR